MVSSSSYRKIKQFLHKTKFCTLKALSRCILVISTGSVVRRDATTVVPRCSREEALMVISSSMVETHRCWGTNCGPSTHIGTRRCRRNHRACSQYCSCWGSGCRGLHRITVPAGSAGQPASAVSKHRVVLGLMLTCWWILICSGTSLFILYFRFSWPSLWIVLTSQI